MASTDRVGTVLPDSISAAQNIPSRAPEDALSSTPVEMNSLQTDGTIGHALEEQETSKSTASSDLPYHPMRTDTTTAMMHAQGSSSQPPLPAIPSSQLSETQATAIGPSTESPSAVAQDLGGSGPKLMITLLLLSGARHPFNLDASYLSRRNVQAQGNDPFNLSVYKVKELILREWRNEWEAKPSSPSAIRLIHFGKVLDDKTAIKDLRFNQTAANVVHMSIKPQDFIDEEDAKGSKATRSRSNDGNEERSPSCRCIVM